MNKLIIKYIFIVNIILFIVLIFLFIIKYIFIVNLFRNINVDIIFYKLNKLSSTCLNPIYIF
jgi:hypothetical protein